VSCAVAGCPKLTKSRFCARHEQMRNRNGSPTARKCRGCGDVVELGAEEIHERPGATFRCGACLEKDEVERERVATFWQERRARRSARSKATTERRRRKEVDRSRDRRLLPPKHGRKL
jgi:hypothetical protein